MNWTTLFAQSVFDSIKKEKVHTFCYAFFIDRTVVRDDRKALGGDSGKDWQRTSRLKSNLGRRECNCTVCRRTNQGYWC